MRSFIFQQARFYTSIILTRISIIRKKNINNKWYLSKTLATQIEKHDQYNSYCSQLIYFGLERLRKMEEERFKLIKTAKDRPIRYYYQYFHQTSFRYQCFKIGQRKRLQLPEISWSLKTVMVMISCLYFAANCQEKY